jgi:hypothetical protein
VWCQCFAPLLNSRSAKPGPVGYPRETDGVSNRKYPLVPEMPATLVPSARWTVDIWAEW